MGRQLRVLGLAAVAGFGLVCAAPVHAQIPTPPHHIFVNDNCYTCGTTLHQGPTDPSQRCLAVGDGQEGLGTSCTEYFVGDGWVCATSNNPCYNVIVHGSLSPAVGSQRMVVATGDRTACLLERPSVERRGWRAR